MLAMMYICSNASINRMGKTSEGAEKPSLKYLMNFISELLLFWFP